MSVFVEIGRFIGATWAVLGFVVIAAVTFLPLFVSPRRARR